MAVRVSGPYGGTGGYPFNIVPPATEGRIEKIEIAPWSIATVTLHGGGNFDSIEVVYRSHMDDTLSTPQRAGGDGGRNFGIAELSSMQYISGIHGNYVEQVTFFAVQQQHGKVDSNGAAVDGPEFQYRGDPATDEIIGFFGRSGHLIDAIGVYVRPRIPEDSR